MAETPPPYYPGAPKKSNTTTVVLIVLGVLAVCCILGIAGLAGGGWFVFNKGKTIAACAMGFEDARRSLEAYATDHNGKLPAAKNWQDEIQPYFAKEAAKHPDERKLLGSFPTDGDWGCKNEDGNMTGIAFNAELAGKKINDLPDDTILLFEVPKAGKNLAQPYKELSDTDSPKLFGKPRGWLKIPVAGKAKIKGGAEISVGP